ncbi:MAG: class F sortase [Nocardioides sp.]
MSISRSLSRPRRAAGVLITVLALLAGALILVAVPPGGAPPAEAATRVAKDRCRAIDPNLVNGVCLRYRTKRGSGLTWIGTYRAPNGRVFFCIDFLYDSRLPREAQTVSTQGLINQLGDRVGDAEVAALNYVISTWAGHGSTGSDERDAAIALIIREVMSDGRRPGGVEVYPRGLQVGERVRPPIGGLGGPIMALAQQMWQEASSFYGPYRVRLTSKKSGPVRLGRSRVYRVEVLSAAGSRVPGVQVRVACRGPIRCRPTLVTKRRPSAIKVRPTDRGRYRIRVTAPGPSSDGLLYRQRSWRPHGGSTARDAGIQRGWIAQESRSVAVVSDTATVKKARPMVVTQTSDAVVTPGAAIHDEVRVTGLPRGYDAMVTAVLHGPYVRRPGPDDCTSATRAGRVRFSVPGNGTYRTPSVTVSQVGYYTWVARFPGNDDTLPVTTRCGLAEETTQVIPFTPRIRTVASRQRAYVGASIHDTVVVRGIQDSPVTVHWTLHGPRPARAGSCEGVSWDATQVAARGSMTVAGDGTYRTPSTKLLRAGCYTYAQWIPATPLTSEATSPPGLAVETALVRRRTPVVTTVVSDQRALVGQLISDAVRVRGLGPDTRVSVRWRLHGPLAPKRGTSCQGLRWGQAAIADRGTFVATGNGTYRTRATRLALPGCYTYSERVPATASTESTSTEPGLRVETSLVTRPVTPYVPEIPTGGASPTGGEAPRAAEWADGPTETETLEGPAYVPTDRAQPRYLDRFYRAPVTTARRVSGGTLSIDRLAIRAPVVGVGLDRGTMAIPGNRHEVGWLSTTAGPGDVLGSSVISGHVSDRRDRPGALWRLKDARRGDVIRWTSAVGTSHRYVVRSVRRIPRTRGVPADLFRTNGPRLLHVVTCTNRRSTAGGFHYRDNLVVSAKKIG